MSNLNLFVVDFQISKASAGGAGSPNSYRKDKRRVTLSAASAHPKDILAVLNADVPVGTGEVIEILSVASSPAVGTEGSGVVFA